MGILVASPARFKCAGPCGKPLFILIESSLSDCYIKTPLQNLAGVLDVIVKDIGEPHYDDPSLALLFSQLRSKTLQAVKGNSEISGRLEFNFVLQIARVFCRMGEHFLQIIFTLGSLTRITRLSHPSSRSCSVVVFR